MFGQNDLNVLRNKTTVMYLNKTCLLTSVAIGSLMITWSCGDSENPRPEVENIGDASQDIPDLETDASVSSDASLDTDPTDVGVIAATFYDSDILDLCGFERIPLVENSSRRITTTGQDKADEMCRRLGHTNASGFQTSDEGRAISSIACTGGIGICYSDQLFYSDSVLEECGYVSVSPVEDNERWVGISAVSKADEICRRLGHVGALESRLAAEGRIVADITCIAGQPACSMGTYFYSSAELDQCGFQNTPLVSNSPRQIVSSPLTKANDMCQKLGHTGAVNYSLAAEDRIINTLQCAAGVPTCTGSTFFYSDPKLEQCGFPIGTSVASSTRRISSTAQNKANEMCTQLGHTSAIFYGVGAEGRIISEVTCAGGAMTCSGNT